MRRDHHAHARAIAGAALLAAVAAGACTKERERAAEEAPKQAERAPPPPPAPQPTAAVEAVKEEPNRYYDKKVRLTGDVDEIYGDRAFRLEGTGWAFNDDIVVLMKKPMEAAAGGPLKTDEELVVSGTVRRFVVTDVERELGWDLSPELKVKLKEHPVLVADSVRRVGPPQAAQEQPQAAAGAQAGQVGTVAEIVAATDPKALAGKKVELGREKVQAIAGKGLWIGPTMTEKVYVVPTAAVPKDINVGDTVTVSGTLQEIPADALTAWKLPKEMAGDLGKTVYVDAETLRKVAAEGDHRRH